jgi:outer membrane lipopolysaccharide assembly protein LptE/RlpB
MQGHDRFGLKGPPLKKAGSFFFLAVLLLMSCGYHFVGSGAKLPEGVRSVAIPIFGNQTLQTGIESDLTGALVNRFLSAKQLSLTSQSQADAVLSGTVKSFVISPTAVTLGTQAATQYRATLTIEATFKRQQDNRVLWKGEMSEWRNYAVASDPAVTEANKKEAIREASDLLARKLYEILLEEF